MEWGITWNETAYQADNTKGWEGTKFNVDGTDHSDTATYDWNGSSLGRTSLILDFLDRLVLHTLVVCKRKY